MSKDRVNFLNVGERCNCSGSIQFKKLIMGNNYSSAMDVAKAQVRVSYSLLCMPTTNELVGA